MFLCLNLVTRLIVDASQIDISPAYRKYASVFQTRLETKFLELFINKF